jgi:hypothetical protein
MDSASGPESCCESCILETERVCAGSVWWLGYCFHIIRPDQCDGSEAVIAFDLSLGREYAAFDSESRMLSNGICGQQVWSGSYCGDYGQNCATEP